MKHKRIWIGVGLLGIAIMALAVLAYPVAEARMNDGNDKSGSYSAAALGFDEGAAEISAGDLSEAEVESLLYMREEEKLAHDVYLKLYEQWGLPIFSNIAASEQSHTEAVLTLLERYGLSDPAAGQVVGEFSDPELQSLYVELLAQGSVSLEGALRVGAAIEEIDILDLEAGLSQVEHSDIRQVYENLLNGSHNHLRAFAKTLEQQTGESYAPQYLDQESYDGIINSASGQGNGGRKGGGSAGGGRGGSRGGQGRGSGSGQGSGQGRG
ncbi:MAG: DUF2202 domain-containing protein [Chloroflexia bacterium]|nr:DUF2202 domain-containing protein [Chloroflexia bacterium]